jgi:hypothetical protein
MGPSAVIDSLRSRHWSLWAKELSSNSLAEAVLVEKMGAAYGVAV